MTSPGPAFQEYTGSYHDNVPTPKEVSSDLRSTDGLTIGQDRDSCHIGTLSTILQHFTHTMKPSDPLLLADVTLRCGMYPAGKVDISRHLATPRLTSFDSAKSEDNGSFIFLNHFDADTEGKWECANNEDGRNDKNNG